MQYTQSDTLSQRPGHETGLRYDDPELGLEWPLPVESISDKDRNWPLLSDIDREQFGERA